jgi:hypothetical protein
MLSIGIVEREPQPVSQNDQPVSQMDRVVSIDEGRSLESGPENAPAEVSSEFEIVLGPRQLGSVLFVATVILGAVCAISYAAGKAVTPKPPASAPEPEMVISGPAIPKPVVSEPIAAPPAEIVRQPESHHTKPVTTQPVTTQPVTTQPVTTQAVANQPLQNATEAPLFADPKPGAVYLQLGAVEKGVAIIMAEGLRKRAFNAFVAPGPNDHIFRVLVGPLDSEAYKTAKQAVDDIGLSTFARKYQQ